MDDAHGRYASPSGKPPTMFSPDTLFAKGFAADSIGTPDFPAATPSLLPKRILLVFPVYEHVLPPAFFNFLALVIHAVSSCPGYKFDICGRERTLLHTAMNDAVDTLLAHDHVALVTFDDDCLPPQDGLTRLLRHFEAGHDFIGSVGVMRNYPYTTTIGKYYPEGPSYQYTAKGEWENAGFYWLDNLAALPSGVIDVDFTGFPMTLLSRRLLTAIDKPAFQHHDQWGGSCTHDIYFCKKVQEAGFTVRVDTTLTCGHITSAPIITLDRRNSVREIMQALEVSHGVHVTQ